GDERLDLGGGGLELIELDLQTLLCREVVLAHHHQDAGVALRVDDTVAPGLRLGGARRHSTPGEKAYGARGHAEPPEPGLLHRVLPPPDGLVMRRGHAP